MDDGNESQRIEIELTPHGSGRDPVTAASPTKASTADGGDRRSGGSTTERGRLVVTAVVVACAALVVGVVVGRVGSGEVASVPDASTSATANAADPVATAAATAATAPATTTAGTGAASTDTLPVAPQASASPTTVGAPAGADESVKGMVAVNPAVAAAPVELVLLTNQGDVVRVDAVTGRTLTTAVRNSQFGPPTIHAGDGWILVPSFNEERGSMVLFDDGTRTRVDGGRSWPLLEGDVDGTFWLVESLASNGAPEQLVLMSVDGGDPLAAVELDGFYPQMADPLGGVVVQAPGGYYVVAPDSTSRFTTGELVAVGRRRALVNECGDSLDCSYFIVDRETGERAAFALDPALGERPTIDSGRWWAFRAPMNADESALLVTYWEPTGGGAQSTGVLDLVTGAYQQIGDAVDTPLMEWSPDGRSVYWLERGRLMVFDRTTGESVLFSEELGTINAFTLRTSLPSVDESSSRGAPDDGEAGG